MISIQHDVQGHQAWLAAEVKGSWKQLHDAGVVIKSRRNVHTIIKTERMKIFKCVLRPEQNKLSDQPLWNH